MSLFQRLGGESKLRAIMVDFYQRVFADVMIGYMFQNLNPEHLVQREYEYTARLLGGVQQYQGRSMARAHESHRITRGHFERRFKILEDTLHDHCVPSEIRDVWLNHTRDLASAVMGTMKNQEGCDSPSPSAEPGAGVVIYR